MVVKIKYFKGMGKLEEIKNGDWIDLRSRETIDLEAGEYAEIPLGVAMKLPLGYEAHIAPRSSTYKKWGIIQTNSVGIVDNSYCGDNDEWKVPVLAIRKTRIHAGDRICQFRIVEKMKKPMFMEVEKLNETDRGGFGSTGTN